MSRKLRSEIADLERENAAFRQEIMDAINILDGNDDPIDWRDGYQPELLRKLCEHLEAWKLKKGLHSSNPPDVALQSPQAGGSLDWPEDFDSPDDNGKYQHRCLRCGRMFLGHKRRITCRDCANTTVKGKRGADMDRIAKFVIAVSVLFALVIGALMALDWRAEVRAGGDLGRNIREGVYPPQVCEECGRTLPHGVRWSEADGVWRAVCVPEGGEGKNDE